MKFKLVQNMFNFLVLSEIAEEELAELSQYSNGDPEMEKAQAEARRDRRRTKITQEMFETEKTYLNHLELVNKVIKLLWTENDADDWKKSNDFRCVVLVMMESWFVTEIKHDILHLQFVDWIFKLFIRFLQKFTVIIISNTCIIWSLYFSAFRLSFAV